MIEVLSSSRPKARKEHYCDSCNQKIMAGEVYIRSFIVNGGDAWTWRAHEACMKAGQILADAGIEGEEGCLVNVCDMDAEDRETVYRADPQIYRAVWPNRPEPAPLRVVGGHS